MDTIALHTDRFRAGLCCRTKSCHGSLTPDDILLSAVLPEDAAIRSDAMRLGRAQVGTHFTVKLCHFGSSCLQPKGVSAYTPPKQVAGQTGDARSDIYALGALLYACLGARPPFEAASRDELCRKIRTISPLPLIGQPLWVRDIIERAMQRAMADRYRVTVDIVNDLMFQRSPAPLLLDAPSQDCSLGHFMPALALQEEDGPAPFSKAKDKTSKGKKPKGSSLAGANANSSENAVAQSRFARALSMLHKPMAFLRRPAADPNAYREAGGEGLPVHGLLGYFNRHMALQEYVRLNSDDPAWKGWRGRLRYLGIRLPVPSQRKPSAFLRWLRDFKLQLPERRASA